MSRDIPFTIRKSSRAKRVSITVYQDAAVVITLPKNMDPDIAEQFLSEKWQWVEKKLRYFEQKRARAEKLDCPKYKDAKRHAREVIKQKLNYFNDYYELEYNDVFIKNQKTKWGSCSEKKNLNFNYKLAFLPEELLDYVVVHELCHLKELNHSERFWGLVAEQIPDWQKRKQQLKQIAL